MALINEHYTEINDTYLFSEISKRVKAYTESFPDKKIIRLGIGDVTQPLPPTVIAAMHAAVEEMSVAATFRGYGPEQGYDFLRDAVSAYYAEHGATIEANEVFISDGAKSDIGNIGDIFDIGNTVLVTDPVYPVYVDTNIMAGRIVKYVDASEENGFLPEPPDFHTDIVYLCSPNNPTGSVMGRALLERWVNYARSNDAVILFDAAYEAYISDPSLPHSIYEIKGAKECTIEFCSLSKTAGFTGTRCAYTIIPQALTGKTKPGGRLPLNKLWNRRQTTKFNGVPYIIQRGAEAVFSKQGREETAKIIEYDMGNAAIIRDALDKAGIVYYGGLNAPYIWLKCPEGVSSWQFFDKLLFEANVVGTPGSGFGKQGEGCFRLTAFATRENTIEACERIRKYL
jgi:LL-diaminopimelate aminotransferase